MQNIVWFVKNRLVNIRYHSWDLRLAIAHRLLRSCEGCLGTTYSKRAYRLARFVSPEPMRVGREVL